MIAISNVLFVEAITTIVGFLVLFSPCFLSQSSSVPAAGVLLNGWSSSIDHLASLRVVPTWAQQQQISVFEESSEAVADSPDQSAALCHC